MRRLPTLDQPALARRMSRFLVAGRPVAERVHYQELPFVAARGIVNGRIYRRPILGIVRVGAVPC